MCCPKGCGFVHCPFIVTRFAYGIGQFASSWVWVSSEVIIMCIWWTIGQPIAPLSTTLSATPHWRDPTKSKQLSTIAWLSVWTLSCRCFYVIISLASLLCFYFWPIRSFTDPTYTGSIFVCGLLHQRVWLLSCFSPIKGWDCDHFGLKWGMFFTLAWYWVSCMKGTNFFRISIGKVVVLSKCSRKWEPFLARRGYMLDPCTNFGGLSFLAQVWIRVW